MRKIDVFIFCICMFISIQSAYAVKITWLTNSAINDDWSEPLNWDLGRIPISTDSVYTFYTDNIDIPANYIAEINYMRHLGDLTIPADSELIFTDGQFEALGTLNNYGIIRVNNSPEEGIICSTQAGNQPFNNFGEIYIDSSASKGLVISSNQIITNAEGALIKITNSGETSLLLGFPFQNGILINSGTLRMKDAGNGIGIKIDNDLSELNNLVCGKIILLDQMIMSDGTFHNAGFFKQDFDGNNDFGDLAITVVNNTGVIEDRYASFDYADFDNQSIWIKRLTNTSIKTGEEVLIFITDTPVGINMGDIYTDNMLTLHAGSYDLSSNIWTPSANANGKTKFFVRAGQQGNTCFDTIKFELEFPVVEFNYWLGGTGNWENAVKWSTGSVPDSTDRAAIYNSTDQVGINNSTVSINEIYLGGQMTITNSGILNITGVETLSRIYMEEGTIINNGVMNFNNGSYGMTVRNATLTNNNQITCIGAIASISILSSGGLTASLVNNGIIETNAGKLIDGDDSVFDNQGSLIAYNPTLVAIDSDGLLNSGTIYVEGDGTSGIGLSGVITNLPSGTIILKELETGAEISGENEGIITANFNFIGIKINGGFTNMNGGQLIAEDCSKGLYIRDAKLTNSDGGLISIERSAEYGMHLGDASSFESTEVENSGLLFVNESLSSGIYNQGTTINKDNGILRVRESTNHGIYVNNASLRNEDQGFIDVKDSDGHAILLEGSLYNYNDGLIQTDSSGISGLYLASFIGTFGLQYSTVTNYARIEIGPQITDFGIQLETGTSILNYQCSGEILCEKKILLEGTFYNYGIYNHLSSETSVIATNLENLGVVHDPFGSLPLPNSWNQGFYLGKKPGTYDEGELINSIVLKDPTTPPNLELDTAWFLNEQLDLPGGIYDPVQNSFTPYGLAVDSSKFYFKVYNTNCTPAAMGTFSLSLQNPINKVCGQIKWVGGFGTSSIAENWDRYRLPGICDSMMVEGLLDSVLINTATPIVIDHITNKGTILLSLSTDLTIKDNSGNGLSNEGQIINKGSLTIQNISMNGYVGSLNSQLTNEGIVLIKDITMQGLELTNGIIHNKVGATFTIDNTMLESIRLKTGALFQQEGILNLNE